MYTSKRLRKTKCLSEIYTLVLKTVWEIIMPNQPCGSHLTMPVVSGSSTDCTGEDVPSKIQFCFLEFDFLRKCSIFDDLILLESLESRKKSQIRICCSTKWQYQLYTWKYVHKEIQIENTTPPEQCCAAALQHLLGWRDQTGQRFSLGGEAVEQLGPACPPLEGSRTQWVQPGDPFPTCCFEQRVEQVTSRDPSQPSSHHQDKKHPPSCLHYPPVTAPGCFRHLSVWLWNSSTRNDVEGNESHFQQGSNHCCSPSQPITQAANTSCKHFSWITVFIPQLQQRPTYKS